MAGNEDLHPILEKIHRVIASLREDVQTLTGEVKKVHSVLDEGFKTLRDAIHENIQAQAELKLMEHLMEVRTVKPQIEAEQEQIEAEKAELDERLDSIAERYEAKHEQLDEKAERRIRDLGEHIFRIDEEEYEEGIEEPFSELVTPTWFDLQEHNVDVQQSRGDAVRDTTGEVVQSIHRFVNRQDELIDEIEDHRVDLPVEADDTEEIQVPYYVVSYEVDGTPKRSVVRPAEQRSVSDAEWVTTELRELDGFESVLRQESVKPGGTVDRQLSGEEVVARMEEYAEQNRLQQSYTDALGKALADRIPVTSEGGGS